MTSRIESFNLYDPLSVAQITTRLAELKANATETYNILAAAAVVRGAELAQPQVAQILQNMGINESSSPAQINDAPPSANVSSQKYIDEGIQWHNFKSAFYEAVAGLVVSPDVMAPAILGAIVELICEVSAVAIKAAGNGVCESMTFRFLVPSADATRATLLVVNLDYCELLGVARSVHLSFFGGIVAQPLK